MCAVYIPSSPKVHSFPNNASNVMDLVGDIVIMGDMNIGNIAWTDIADTCHLRPSNCYSDLENALITLCMSTIFIN